MSETGETEQAESAADYELFLTPQARYGVTLGTTFSYRGNSHWPKVKVEDAPAIEQDDEGNVLGYEDTESLIYRVDEIAHRLLSTHIARMKRDIDDRASADLAARRAATDAAAENVPS